MATTTPMRPVPGAFLNTPAAARNDPTRRRLFNEPSTPSGGQLSGARPAAGSGPVALGSSGGGLQSPAQSTRAGQTAGPLPPITKAAKSVNDVLQLDESYPDLDSYCRRKSSVTFPCCGYLSSSLSLSLCPVVVRTTF